MRHGMCAEAHPPLRAFASLMDLDARGRRGCVIGGDTVAGALERANRPCGDQAVTDQRHGGKSGTEVESTGLDENAGVEPAGTSGVTEEAPEATTAGGPIREAAMAVTGSDVLRQEHE
jgi:hypothetical protein